MKAQESTTSWRSERDAVIGPKRAISAPGLANAGRCYAAFMTAPAKNVKIEALRPSPPDRAALARELLRSLDGGEDPDTDAAWDAELVRRWSEIESGTGSGRPASEVLAELGVTAR